MDITKGLDKLLMPMIDEHLRLAEHRGAKKLLDYLIKHDLIGDVVKFQRRYKLEEIMEELKEED